MLRSEVLGAQLKRRTLAQPEDWSIVDVGTDRDGRSISFDETTGHLSIGGIATTIDRLVAYDRGGQVTWASPEIRDWAYEYESKCAEYVSEQEAVQSAVAAQQAAASRESARRASLVAAGYDSSATVGLAAQFRGLAMLIMISFGLLGAFFGLALGAASDNGVVGLIMLLVCGGGGLLFGYLATLVFKTVAHVLTTLVQIEMNTRPRDDRRAA